MREGWKEYRLEDVAQIKYGKDHKKLSDGKYPLYGSGGIMRYVDSYLSNDESVLIPRKGTLSNLFYLKEPFSTVDTMFWTIIDKSIAVPRFLFYLLKTYDLVSLDEGAAIPSLTTKSLNTVKIQLPPLFTQQKIADILSAYDNLIENNLKRIQLLEEQAQLMYEEWFVRMRFPGHEDAVMNAETGLPAGWERVKIENLGRVITGKTPSTNREEYYLNGEVPFIKTPDLANSCYILTTNQMLSLEGANSQINKFLPKNSLVVSCIGTAGEYGLVSEPSQTNQQINSIIFNRDELSFYSYCFAKYLKPTLDALGSNGATMTNVNKSKFEQIEVIIPIKSILDAFHDLVKNNFNVIHSLQKQNRLLQEARDLLLPRLMMGIIDVEAPKLGMVAEERAEYNIKK